MGVFRVVVSFVSHVFLVAFPIMHSSLHHASQQESYINFVCSGNRRHFIYNQFIIDLFMTYSYPLISSPDYDLLYHRWASLFQPSLTKFGL